MEVRHTMGQSMSDGLLLQGRSGETSMQVVFLEGRLGKCFSYLQCKVDDCIPGDSKWPVYPLGGGHLTFERVTWPSQKGHKELSGTNFFSLHLEGFVLSQNEFRGCRFLMGFITLGKIYGGGFWYPQKFRQEISKWLIWASLDASQHQDDYIYRIRNPNLNHFLATVTGSNL